MKQMTIEQMEMIEGGRNWFACDAGLGGLVAFGIAIASVSVTGLLDQPLHTEPISVP